MQLYVNERSFLGQAGTEYDAFELMKGLGELLRALKPLRGDDTVCSHSTLWNQKLSSSCTVYDWLHSSSIEPDQRAIFVVLAKNGPFVEDLIKAAGINCDCAMSAESIAFSSIAAAAHFTGFSVSLKGSNCFDVKSIPISVCPDGEMYSVPNLVESADVSGYRRQYKASIKHMSGGIGTEMDLDDETAQRVLDAGVLFGKKVYGFLADQYYVFQPESFLVYHGYPVDENKVPSNPKRQILKLRIIG